MSNYTMPPAILPTPPTYQDIQQPGGGGAVDYTFLAPNSLLGSRPPHVQNTDNDSSFTMNQQVPPVNTSVVPNTPLQPGVSAAKMFVGGLPQSVTQETLREYFGRYGNIVEAFVLMDEQSGRSRGFGFVTFENAQSLNDVLAARPHYLAGKHVDCKHAVLKSSTTSAPLPRQLQGSANDPQNEKLLASHRSNFPMHPLSHQQRTSFDAETVGAASADNDEDDLFLTGGGKSYLALSGDKWLEDCAEADERKIFVGGLPDVTPAEFAGFFEHFGPVADAMVMFDRKRRRQRGFGFITFATNDGVTNALKYHRHPVKGKLVEVKKAHPLVLQKARAPARRERDQQLQAQQQAQQQQQQQQGMSRRGSPSLTSTKRKTSSLDSGSISQQAPWITDVTSISRTAQDPWKRLRPEEEDVMNPGGGDIQSVGAFDARYTSRFPLAPWNQGDSEQMLPMNVEESQWFPTMNPSFS